MARELKGTVKEILGTAQACRWLLLLITNFVPLVY